MSLSVQIKQATLLTCALLAAHAPSSAFAQDLAQPPKATSAPSPRRVTVITSNDIQRRNITRLDELFQGLVPGFIAMDVGSSSPAMWQGRGVAFVGTPTRIRVFLNGVELDNPAHISRLNPEYVERIEVTSGFAQGAEDGATGGVIRILTKHREASIAGPARSAFRPTISTLLSAGTENSLYDRNPTLTQRYALNAVGGGQRFGYFLGGGYTGNGNYAPSSKANGSDALLGLASESRFVSARMFGAIGRTTSDLPSPRTPVVAAPTPFTRQMRTKNNSFGGTVAVTLTPWWKQELRAGSSYSDLVTQGQTQGGSPGNTGIRIDQEARRLSYGYVSTFLLPQLSIVRPKFRAGYEHVRYYSAFDSVITSTGGGFGHRRGVESPLTSYYGTVDLTIADAFALEFGARRNRDDRIKGSEFQHNWLPYASAAYAFTPGPLRVTARGAYGAMHSKTVDPGDLFGWPPKTTFTTIRQRMIGSEAGVDLALRNGPQFSVIFFDQHGRDGQFNPLAPFSPRSGGQLITQDDFHRLMVDLATRGVELSAQWSKGPFDTRAAYSVAKTKVDRTWRALGPVTGPGWLREGDVLSGYPRQTGGLSLSYALTKTTVGTEIRYLGSYAARNYLATDSAGSYLAADSARYSASAVLNLTVTHALAPGINLLGYVQNLTNTERYAPTNSEYTRGRRIGLGVRTQY